MSDDSFVDYTKAAQGLIDDADDMGERVKATRY